MNLDMFVIIVAMATIGSYLWSVKHHFESGALEAGAKFISIMVIACTIIFSTMTLLFTQSTTVQATGLVLQCAAFVLFWITIRETRSANLLAVFTEKDPTNLVTTGPYRFVRHPFYSAYLLFWLGWAVATSSLWSLLLFGIIFITYWRAADHEENKFKNTPMAGQYAQFKKGRARFIPFLL